MKQKIFKKYFFTTSVICLLGILVLVLCLSLFVRNYLEQDKKKLMWENEAMISSFVTQRGHSDQARYDAAAVMRVTGNLADATFFASRIDGTVFACGCENWIENGICYHSAEPVNLDVMRKATADKYYKFGYLDQKTESVSYITAMPMYNMEGKVCGAIFGISPSYTMRELMRNMYKVFAISLIIPIVILFVALYVMTLRLTKPMRKMSEAAKSIAKGDFSKRIPVWGDDEITELSVSFNNMTDSLSRLESMRRSFIGNVSHELRTPMTTIGGFIDGILDGTIEKDQQEHYLRIISEEVKRLTRLVQSMLSLAKLESGEMQPNCEDFDLSRVVLDVVISQEQRVEEQKLKINGLEDLKPVVVSADKGLIHQVIYNLVDNAVKFAGAEGYVSFSVTATQQGKCIFKIRNSGIGINQEDIPYVFDRFYKGDKSRSSNKDSSGLGLYLVKTIVTIHGGTVDVTSVPGQYTEFEIVLSQKSPTANDSSERR